MRLLLVVLPLLFAPPGANAGDHDPVTAVEASLARAHAIAVREDERRDRLSALHAVARTLVDTEEMGRLAAGDAFATAAASERREFLALFDELIVRSYLQKLLFFRTPRFAVGRAERVGDSIVVHTRIETKKDEFYVDYEMRERDASWKATDIIVEGVSLRESYASQFRSLLRSRTFEELVTLMRRKVRGLRGDT